MGAIVLILLLSLQYWLEHLCSGQDVAKMIKQLQISQSNAQGIVTAFDNVSDHRFSIIFIGGEYDGQSEIGDRHPTIVDQAGQLMVGLKL